MDTATMRADCAQCAALCCVALAFDRSAAFAIDKPNGVPCLHLDAAQRCGIYPDREARGFGGCVRYDCLGAGQRVTQEIFKGRSWRSDPSILDAMVQSFVGMRDVHDLLLLLQEAGKAPLSPEERCVLRELDGALQPSEGWSPEALAAFRDGPLPKRVRGFLASLRGHFSREPQPSPSA